MAYSTSPGSAFKAALGGRSGAFSPVAPSSLGDTSGANGQTSWNLQEYPNNANSRNLGPTRSPGLVGGTSMPILTIADRKTGRVGLGPQGR